MPEWNLLCYTLLLTPVNPSYARKPNPMVVTQSVQQ